MRFNSAVVKNLSNTVRAVAIAANLAEYHSDNFGFALFYLKIVYLIALAILFACTYKLVAEGYGTAGIYPVQCKLVHTGFYSHRGFFALAGRVSRPASLCGSQGTRVRPRGPDAAGDWDRGHGAGSGARRGPDSMEPVSYLFLKASP